MKNKCLDLTQGNILPLLLAFILPIIAGSLIQQLYTTVDAVIVGQFVGKSGLAAIDSVATLFKFPLNFLSGLSSGATVVISGYFGSRSEKDLDCSVHTAYTLAVILGIVCSIAGFLLTPWLLHIMAVPAEIYAMTLGYCQIYFAGIWAMTLYNMVAGILRAFGDSKSPFFILIICCIVNIIGDLLLVGIFHGGVNAAAAATVLSQIISSVLALRSLAKVHSHCNSHVWQIRICKEHLIQITSIGFPLGIQGILFPIANSIIHASINSLGTDAIAAWAVCGKLDLLIWLVADAMSPALATYVSQNRGANRNDRIFRGSLIGAAMSFFAVGVISLALFFIPGPLGSLFISSRDAGQIIPLVITYMKMMAPFYVFYSLAESFSGCCYGMGDTVRPMLITLLCTCLLRVVCIFFVLPHFGTMECIVYIYIASWIATGCVFTLLFLHKIRK